MSTRQVDTAYHCATSAAPPVVFGCLGGSWAVSDLVVTPSRCRCKAFISRWLYCNEIKMMQSWVTQTGGKLNIWLRLLEFAGYHLPLEEDLIRESWFQLPEYASMALYHSTWLIHRIRWPQQRAGDARSAEGLIATPRSTLADRILLRRGDSCFEIANIIEARCNVGWHIPPTPQKAYSTSGLLRDDNRIVR